MATPRSRPRISQDMRSGVVQPIKADIEQVRRSLVSQERPAPATPGSMQGFTRATAGSAFWSGGGVTAYGWTFDTSIDQSGLTQPALAESGTYFGPTEAGHYCTKLTIQFTLGSGTPAGVLMQQNPGGYADVTPYAEQWAMGLIDGRYRAVFSSGVFWLDGTTRPLGAAAIIPGTFTAGSLVNAYLDVWRVG